MERNISPDTNGIETSRTGKQERCLSDDRQAVHFLPGLWGCLHETAPGNSGLKAGAKPESPVTTEGAVGMARWPIWASAAGRLALFGSESAEAEHAVNWRQLVHNGV
ncbi:hypothetical protein AAFF_G00407530 [Aldrovandia affinis]|uniref:Uncharacterized protein n=1 Tax=Aldrovandia affinis TaxID=143900 RepID=A0AAD7SC69_9TELE|nr:hypothetical protein AAFF_G00407530 [Aldrovandia affinis]